MSTAMTIEAGPSVVPHRSEVIRLDAVTKVYPGPPPVHALHHIDLAVDAGEFLAIMGPSGSGKSTLLNVIGLLDRPTSGAIMLDGHDVATLRDSQRAAARAHRIGFVFQHFQLIDGQNARDNVANGLLYRGVARRERRRRADRALAQVGLDHRADHRPSKLSGGERQRVAIARALVGEPAFVLADEPTGNLDSANSVDILRLLHDLHALGNTIIVITHDASIASRCPRRVEVRDGRIVADERTSPPRSAPGPTRLGQAVAP
jgi:putative ABC transport system ATP-binding protein